MKSLAIAFLLIVISLPSYADVPFDSMGADTWRQVPTLNQYPACGVDIHANCDTSGNMYMVGGCTYGNVAGGTHNADVYRFDLKTGNTYKLYDNSTNPVRTSCQSGQAYDKTRNCIWFSFGNIYPASPPYGPNGLFRFQCPSGPITKVSDTSMAAGYRGNCYLYYDAVNDLLIGPNAFGLVIRNLATGDTEHVAYPSTVNYGYNFNELPSCFDTKRGLFAMTQWGACWCAGGAEPVNPPILHDVWLYNTTTKQWLVRSPVPNPGPNFSGEMTYDAGSDKYVYFGSGRLGYGLPELWSYDYDTNQWTQVQQNGRTFQRSNLAASTWPAQRYKHAWTYCEKYNVLVSWGGYNYIAAEAGVVFDSNNIDFWSGAHQPLWYYRLSNTPQAAAEVLFLPAADHTLLASPNPFYPSTNIHLPEATARNGKAMLLKIYSPEGRLIADLSGRAMTGRNVTWDAAGIPAGLYVVKYTAGRRTWETKAVLAR